MSNRKKPNLVDCPYCGAPKGFECRTPLWPDGYPMGTEYHEARAEKAWIKFAVNEGSVARPPKTSPMTLKCPRCKEGPGRVCRAPAPFRSPVATHKARWLLAERIDNRIQKARGRKGKDVMSQPPEERPWLKNRKSPPNKKDYGFLRQVREERKAEEQADE